MSVIAINLEGGLIQSVGVVFGKGEGPESSIAGVVVLDYDIDDSDPGDTTEVPQEGGDTADAYVHELWFEQWPENATTAWVREVYAS